MTQQPLGGDSLLIIEASLSHSETPHTVGLLWTSDRPVAKELHPTTHNTHMRQTSMATARFEPPTPAIERPQTHALERAATGTGTWYSHRTNRHGYHSYCTRLYKNVQDWRRQSSTDLSLCCCVRADVSKHRSAFVYRVNQSQKCDNLTQGRHESFASRAFLL